MSAWWWAMLGAAGGMLIMLPIQWRLLRQVERRARQAERRARHAERMAELGRMTGGLAHEIKNPLSTIGLNAQLLAEGLQEADLPAEQRERLRRRLEALSREAERLRGILTDFLQFAGRVRLDPQRRDLVRVIEALADFFHPQCVQAGAVLRTQLPSRPVTAMVDESLLKQALLNLMINAVQAMRPTAEVATARDGAPRRPAELIVRLDAEAGHARIHVIDTGPGIEPDKLEQIFHPYVSFKSGGSGLGLPTARRIVEEHGGQLLVQSTPGQGSDFIIRLPLGEPAAHPQGLAPKPQAGG